MADRKNPPGRTLAIFFLGIAILYGLVALAGDWKPALGLDLQGGTRITLTAAGDPSEENLEEARRIIDQRVNGSGIVEAEVTRQSTDYIVVEVPGRTENRAQLEETVRRTAQLRFRLVACASPGDESRCVQGQGGLEGLEGLDLGQLGLEGDGLEGLGRPAPALDDHVAEEDANEDEVTEDETEEPADSEEAPDLGPDHPWNADAERTVDDEIAWMNDPDPRSAEEYNRYTCEVEEDAHGQPIAVRYAQGDDGEHVRADAEDHPDRPLVACEVRQIDGEQVPFKYLLSRSVIEGTELNDASAGIPQGEVRWVVNLELGNSRADARHEGWPGASSRFESISRALVGTERQFAIVLDGTVISAPVMQAVITNGRSQISGDFNEASANHLATSLKYGALPIDFPEDEISVEDVGPSLAGDQLTTGLWAGGIGLALVMLYCLIYYRGLGFVVMISVALGAIITYAIVLLLSETAGFTLTLPGLAGFIIAIGIVGDSFIIYFERLRDEMREGKSVRVAVETGWVRARKTRIAANTVTLLSALILYIFATGAVKGFGFALGISTLIDLAVLFWFTKPFVTWVAKFKFFSTGHKWSGLSKATLGTDRPATVGVSA
jgi:preprotein translocase subunit SecD